MKKLIILLTLCLLAGVSAAIITDFYAPPVSSAGTYSAITGTTPAVSGEGYFPDEELTVALPLGFSFSYCGVNYTQAKMSTNGYLAMGTAHEWFYSYENMLSSTSSQYYPFIAPLWDDLMCENMSYTTTGTAPNRVFIAQWANATWDYSGNPGQNFQVKLYETSNKIEFVYGPLITPSYPSATIGINMAPGGTGNFYSITPGNPISSSTNVENSNINSITYLTSGTTYTFNAALPSAPNPAVVIQPANNAISVTVTTNLIWTSGGHLPTGYRLFLGTDGGGTTPPTNLVNNLDLGNNTVYDPPFDLAINTIYYWQIVPYNAQGSATGCPIWKFTTGGLPLRGEKTINPAGSGSDNYTSFTAAINALNSLGVGQDGVIFYVPAGLTFNETAMIPAITTTGTQENPITFQKSGTGANPLVTVPGTTGAQDYVFKLTGVNYITFDGISVANAGSNTNVEYGYWLANSSMTGGSSNNIIKNCTVTLNRSNNSSCGVFSEAVTAANNNNLYQNITINNAYEGIVLSGRESSADSNSNIEGCIFNSIAENNMQLQYQAWVNIYDNLINYPTSEPCASTIYGFNSYEISNAVVYNNTFSGGNVTRTIYNIFFNVPAQIEVHHNTISGTVTTSPWWQGIYVNSPSWGSINIHHNVLHDITSGMTWWGIYTMRAYDININDNQIYNISTASVFWGIHSIENLNLDTPTNIYNNIIHDITLTGELLQMVSGINVQDRYANIYNNMVYHIVAPNTTYNSGSQPQVCGISLQDMQATQSERAYVYNNTVLMDATGTNNSTTSCLYSSFAGPVDLKNNIFVNRSVPGVNGRAVAFTKNNTSFDNFVATMDKNIYYAGTPDASHLIYYDGTNSCQTLAEYKALNVGKDQNSFTENVPFLNNVNPYDLHINPAIGTVVESNGISLSIVLDDIDGDLRSATPDIGADEGNFTVFTSLATPENVTITKVGNNVQISWNAVSGATGYRIYGSDLPYTEMPWGTPLTTVSAPATSTLLSPTSVRKFYYVTAFH